MNLEKIEKEKNAVLILAASYKAYDNSFILPEPFLNISNTLIIERIRKNCTSKNNIYIAVNNFPFNLQKLKSFDNFNFINVGSTNGVIDTIKESIRHIKEENINILPITTVPDSQFSEKNSIYFGDKKISKENWSAISYINETKIEYLFKKKRIDFKKKCFPFTGRISTEKNNLKDALKEINNNQINDLLYLARILIEKYGHSINHEKWYDAGHSTTYFETKISSFSSRFFNQIKYNHIRNSIVKTSQDNVKLNKEINFYKKIPSNLKGFFPILLNQNTVEKEILELEYLTFPNLAEIFLFRKIGANRWETIVKSLYGIYSEFYLNNKSRTYLYDTSHLYSKKLQKRIKILNKIVDNLDNVLLKKIINNGIKVNNNFLPSLISTTHKIQKELVHIEQKRPLFFGHGDLCFNNILIDPISGCIKLIDPRADFISNNKIGYVDPYYDLAKLNHSFECFYDSIVNNMFSISFENNQYELKIFKPFNYEVANFYFKKIFLEKLIDKELLRILTSNLFLSMIPLHKEDEQKMGALLIIGISLFYDIDMNKYILEI
tara:strand:+ start:91 stop:1740 length:1650 start_codon:yes stop_codon:yes gene_type:complete